MTAHQQFKRIQRMASGQQDAEVTVRVTLRGQAALLLGFYAFLRSRTPDDVAVEILHQKSIMRMHSWCMRSRPCATAEGFARWLVGHRNEKGACRPKDCGRSNRQARNQRSLHSHVEREHSIYTR